jgi:PAS domain S-box-containing protein
MNGKKETGENENRKRKLRDSAEDQLARRSDGSVKLPCKNPEDLIHELRVHQIELETENEDLRRMQGELDAAQDADGAAVCRAVLSDITDHKRTEEALRESEEKFSKAFQTAPYAITITSPKDGKFVEINDAFIAITGFTREEALSGSSIGLKLWVNEDDRQRVVADLQAGRTVVDREFQFRKKNGEIITGLFSAQAIQLSRGTHIFSSINDITERKRTDDDLKEALEKYRSLAAYADSMYLVDRDCTYLFMNDRNLKRFGLSLEEVVGKKYGEFHSEEVTRQFAEYIGEVCETGKESTQEHRSERDGRYFLRTFTPIMGQSSDGNISQVAIISKEITNIKLAEKNLRETLESLRKAVNTTIRVMVAAVETRDPYTAGHQIRSADLARAIATEMELTQEKIDAIRMAGSIHDIGKLSIPAEILSKPTELSSIEFSLIKEHARQGYEILKNVDSPWPLAEIVYQHHERMDGTGYPRNLKGGEICIEARILAVADVVESMASHRPYRAGLGIDVAMEEISKNSGILYDPEVTDSCLRLFQEKGYRFPEG